MQEKSFLKSITHLSQNLPFPTLTLFGKTSLNMTPWTTATLILASPLMLRYADDVARFSLVSIAIDMLEPVSRSNFMFEQPLPCTSFVHNISKQEHLLCFVGGGRDANMQKPFAPKFIPTKVARTMRCLGLFLHLSGHSHGGCNAGIAHLCHVVGDFGLWLRTWENFTSSHWLERPWNTMFGSLVLTSN